MKFKGAVWDMVEPPGDELGIYVMNPEMASPSHPQVIVGL